MAKLIRKGELVLVESGEYSDFGVHYLGRAICDFSVDSLVDEYIGLHPEEAKRYSFKAYSFVAYLQSKNYLLPVAVKELCVGSFAIDEVTLGELDG